MILGFPCFPPSKRRSISLGNFKFGASGSKKDNGLSEGLVCGLCGGPAKRIGNCAIRCTSCNTTQRSGCGE